MPRNIEIKARVEDLPALEARAAELADQGPIDIAQDDNALLLVDAHGERELPHASKLNLARALGAEIAQRLAAS